MFKLYNFNIKLDNQIINIHDIILKKTVTFVINFNFNNKETHENQEIKFLNNLKQVFLHFILMES